MHWMQYQKKMVFWAGQEAVDFAGTAAQTDNQFNFYLHTGYGTDRLWFITLTVPNDGTPTEDPWIQWRTTGGDITSNQVFFELNTVATYGMDGIRYSVTRASVVENRDYHFFMRTKNNVRILGVCVAEEFNSKANTDSAIGHAANFSDKAPILDADIAALQNMGEKLWGANSAHLFSYSAGAANVGHDLQITSATYVNAFNTSDSTFTTGEIGVLCNTEFMGSRYRRKVPCRLAIKAKDTRGSGRFKIVDTSGDVSREIKISQTTADWYITDLELDDTNGGHEIAFFAKTAGTLDIYAINLYQYQREYTVGYSPGHLDGFELSFNTTSTVDIAAGDTRDSTDAADISASTSNTIDITASGANGLDTGAEANSTWYYVYAIKKDSDSSVDGLLSTSASSPTMPGGYTYFRRVGAVYNNSSGNIEDFTQHGQGRDRWTWWDQPNNFQVLSSGSATTDTTVDCSSAAPSGARTLNLTATFAPNATTSWFICKENGQTGDTGKTTPGVTATVDVASIVCPCDGSQVIEYVVSSASDNLDLEVVAYLDEL